MKKIISVLIFTVVAISSNAQVMLDDFGRIVLNTYLPDNIAIPSEANTLLITKLNQITSNNGMGGSAINPRFIITASVNIGTKDIIAGPPQMIAQNMDVTFFVADALTNTVFSNTSLSLKGIGTNENKAFIEAFKTINPKNKELKSFLNEGKNKIINYYNTQCEFIIRDALSLSKKGEYDAAIHKLVVVPDVCENCHRKSMDTMQYIYQQKIDKECLLIMRNAQTTWMANQNSTGAAKVAEIINTISPFSTCEPDAGNLMRQVQSKLAAEEKAQWELQIQEHRDAVKLKEEALRIDEEDRKRQVALQKDAQKQQYSLQKDAQKQQYSLQIYAQKQQYSLQKDAQKQQYSLQKVEQEVGGFRGVVNSLVKLKMSFWRAGSQQYLNSQQIDYSKVKLN